jgi:hypothetical protein
VKVANGSVVKLEVARIGSRWVTSRAALERFVARLTAASTPTPADTPAVPSAASRRRAEAADRELSARLAGV